MGLAEEVQFSVWITTGGPAGKVPIIDDLSEIVEELDRANNTERRVILGSREGVKAFGDCMRRLVPAARDQTEDEWCIAGIPVEVQSQVMTKNLSLYVGASMYAVLDPQNEKVIRFDHNPMVMQAPDIRWRLG